MTTLGGLRLGTAFRTQDGRVGVRWGVEGHHVGRAACLWLDGHGFTATPPADTPADPLDLPALLAERDELLALTHDLLIDSEAERRGREAERGEVARLLEVYVNEAEGERSVLAVGSDAWRAVRQRLALARCLLEDVRARGPAAAPDPPARLAARVRELEGALRGLLDALLTHAGDAAYYTRALAPARAALTGAGGKQPT
jgi:hypothetical protein